MSNWVIVTVVMFTSFVAMCLIILWPTREKPYKDAERLALKEDTDPLVTPRHPGSSEKRT